MQSHFSSHFPYPSSLLQSLCSPFFHTSGLSCMHRDVVPICEGWHNCWHNFFRLDPRLDRASRESVRSNCSSLAILMCVHTNLFAFMYSVLPLKKQHFLKIFLRLFFWQLLELFFLLSVCSLKKHIVVSAFYIVCAHSCNHRATRIAVVQTQDLCRLHEWLKSSKKKKKKNWRQIYTARQPRTREERLYTGMLFFCFFFFLFWKSKPFC